MAKRSIEDCHRRIVSSFRRLANHAQFHGNGKLRNKYLKLLLRYQLLNFNRN